MATHQIFRLCEKYDKRKPCVSESRENVSRDFQEMLLATELRPIRFPEMRLSL